MKEKDFVEGRIYKYNSQFRTKSNEENRYRYLRPHLAFTTVGWFFDLQRQMEDVWLYRFFEDAEPYSDGLENWV